MSSAREFTRRVTAFIEEQELFRSSDRLLVGASGGLDSSALVHYLTGAGYTIGLAHCNYHQRGRESDRDEVFVRGLGDRYGCAVHCFHYPNDGAHADSDNTETAQLNFQESARLFRYTHFKKILNEYDYELLLTAHHLDDNLETLLMHLGRASGLPGLAGIPVRTDFPLARPFLGVSRDEIEQFAKDQQLQWRTDRSNESDTYLRNRIRHHLIPSLKQTLNLPPRTLQRVFRNLRSSRVFYERGLSLSSNPELHRVEKGWRFDVRGSQLGPSEQFTLLRHHLLTNYPISEADLRYVLTLRDNQRWTDNDLEVRNLRGVLFFTYGRTDSDVVVHIDTLPFTFAGPFHRYRFSLTAAPRRNTEPGAWALKVPRLPLHLRPRKKGERMRPSGLGGSKKIKDILIDAKVPVWERDAPLVLCDGENRIVALLGLCTDESHRPSAEDREVLLIRKLTSPPSG